MDISSITLARYGVKKVREEMNSSVTIGVVGSSGQLRRRLITWLFPDVLRFEDAWILPDVIPEHFSVYEMDWESDPQELDAVVGVFDPVEDAGRVRDVVRHLEGHMDFVVVMGTSHAGLGQLVSSLSLAHLRLLRHAGAFEFADPDAVSMEVRERRRAQLLLRLTEVLEDRRKALSFVAYLGDSFLKERYVRDRIHRTALAGALLFLFELYSFPTIKALVSLGRETAVTERVAPPTMVDIVDGLVNAVVFLHTRRAAPPVMVERVRTVMRWGLTPMYLMSGISGGAMSVLVYALLYALGMGLDLLLEGRSR